MTPSLSKQFLNIQANYRLWIHSEIRTQHNNGIQPKSFPFIEINQLSHEYKMYRISRSKQELIKNLAKVFFNHAIFRQYLPNVTVQMKKIIEKGKGFLF